MAGNGAESADVQTAIFKKLYPVDFLRRHLEEQVREDGRALDEFRPVSLATGILTHGSGSALVRFGAGTMVTAAVQAQVTEPHHDRPHEGFIVPSIDLSPLCSPQYRLGPPSDDAQALSHYLQLFLDQSQALPRESLCIEPGVAVWSLHVDVVCVSADGNVLDAAALAAIAALGDCKLPHVLHCESAQMCVCARERTEKLALQYLPILSTFGLYDSYVFRLPSTYLLADLAAFEESLVSARTHIGIGEASDDADVFFLRHAGNALAARAQGLHNGELLEHCIDAARTHAKVLRKLVRESLKQ
ncbi:hypothetical protein MOBT1_002032 [Malassezia obtusa]|uniref:Ribosomal RNA-processing protein 43 n=1 Tax=Malassezia obtusa TaxID=76774 RepID=A0AAF0E583_9BASI|nr:hypothetical protein MOBT1_002032 [Malassezia obtusa]